MSPGELLTRLSIWLAVGAYTVGAAMLLESDTRPALRRTARWAWTVGCSLFLVHVIAAFSSFHHWSHVAAYEETARQTAALSGWRSGGGIYLNYFLAVAWVADVLWWWLAPVSFFRRPAWLTAQWHGFFYFMVFNGAVVFAHGPMRWIGAALCCLLAVRWWQRRKRNSILAASAV